MECCFYRRHLRRTSRSPGGNRSQTFMVLEQMSKWLGRKQGGLRTGTVNAEGACHDDDIAVSRYEGRSARY
jgi:hypothetical protein